MAKAASIEELLKSGAHFGHLTRRWNPKMREFIFMQRNGIHVIDLNKTHALLQESLDEIGKVARSGKNVLFVGTKKQAQEIIRTEAQRCDMPHVTHRWLGGMLTNFVTIKKSISRMEEINAMQTDGTYDNITKKERLMLDREKSKLEDVMGGISKMNRLPGALFVVDIVKESIAVNEALKLNIPIFALVDTNCDPDVPDHIIPCNDDAAKAIQLVASNIADAITEGMAEREAYQEEQLATESMAQQEGDEAKQEMSEADVKTTRRKRSRKAKTTAKEQPASEKTEKDSSESSADEATASKPEQESTEKSVSQAQEEPVKSVKSTEKTEKKDSAESKQSSKKATKKTTAKSSKKETSSEEPKASAESESKTDDDSNSDKQ